MSLDLTVTNVKIARVTGGITSDLHDVIASVPPIMKDVSDGSVQVLAQDVLDQLKPGTEEYEAIQKLRDENYEYIEY